MAHVHRSVPRVENVKISGRDDYEGRQRLSELRRTPRDSSNVRIFRTFASFQWRPGSFYGIPATFGSIGRPHVLRPYQPGVDVLAGAHQIGWRGPFLLLLHSQSLQNLSLEHSLRTVGIFHPLPSRLDPLIYGLDPQRTRRQSYFDTESIPRAQPSRGSLDVAPG